MRIRRVPLAFALVAAVAGGAGARALLPQELPPIQQCYHRVSEPPGTCSICMNRCYGDGYKCCLVITS